MTERLIVGIDGGATHSTAVVVDDSGQERARVEGGPGIVNPADPAACVGRLAMLARRAITKANAYAPVHALSCALAGAGRAELRDVVRAELLREQVARNVTVTTDAEAALADAFGELPGILLIAGTGSIAWGRGEDGRLVRCGGWGVILGDEGSGYGVGLEGLRASVRAADGRGPATGLLDAILDALRLDRADDLIGWVARAGKHDVAALTPLVLEHADAGDEVAVALRTDAARALADHVRVLHERLGPWRQPPTLALAGGLGRPGGPLRTAILDALAETGLAYRLHEQPIDAARGAARLARVPVGR